MSFSTYKAQKYINDLNNPNILWRPRNYTCDRETFTPMGNQPIRDRVRHSHSNHLVEEGYNYQFDEELQENDRRTPVREYEHSHEIPDHFPAHTRNHHQFNTPEDYVQRYRNRRPRNEQIDPARMAEINRPYDRFNEPYNQRHIPQPPPYRGEPPRIHNNYNDYVNMGQRDYSNEAFYNRDQNFIPPPMPDINAPSMSEQEIQYWHRYLQPYPHDSEEQRIWKQRVFDNMIAIENYKADKIRSQERRRLQEEMYQKTIEEFKQTQLTTPAVHKFKMKSTQAEQLGIINEKCDTDRAVADTNHIMLTMIKKLAEDRPMDPTLNQMIAQASSKINEQTKSAYTKKAALEGTKVMAHMYEHRLERPEMTNDPYYDAYTLKKLEPRNILQAVKYYNPDNAQNTTDFSDTWRHIISYTHRLRLTESTYIEILLMVLQGSAHKIVFEMSRDNASLNDILDILSNLYVKKKTILDDMREVNTFKRKAGEPILTAMSRARILLEKVKHMYSTYAWPEYCERFQISILKQVISPATRKHIDLEETKKLRIGIIADYQSLLEMVDTFEAAHGEIPTTEISTTVGACSGVPTAPLDTASMPSEILTTKIANLESIVLNAIDPKDRRSLKERTKSSSRDRSKNSSRERSRKDLFERHLKQYAKIEEEEKKQKPSSDKRSSSSYSESGYDRKKKYKQEQEKEKRDAKTVDKYLSRSRSKESESRDSESRKRYDRSRSQSSNRSRRSSSYRSGSRSSTRSNKNYHEKERSRSYEKKKSYKNDYRNKSPHPKKNSTKNYKNYDKKDRPRKSYDKREIYENYPKLTNKRHGPNGELTGFTIENNYYIQCTRPRCQQAHLEGTKCNLN